MPTVYLATLNEHKVQELIAILATLGRRDLDVRPAAAIAPDLIWDEVGSSFVENARIKALAVRDALGKRGMADAAWVLADDSGLEVDALGGQPGVHSSRYAGAGATAEANNAKLRAALAKLDPERRRQFPARFTCALCFIDERGREQAFTGVCEGAVVADARGRHGFGYDPLFIVQGRDGLTMAELPEEEKNRLSHRRKALDLWLGAIS